MIVRACLGFGDDSRMIVGACPGFWDDSPMIVKAFLDFRDDSRGFPVTKARWSMVRG